MCKVQPTSSSSPHFNKNLNPKFYPCNLYKQPKRGDYNISILGWSKVSLTVFVIGQSKMPIQKKNNRTLGLPKTN
jgi:hypothetical protein